MKKSDWLDHLTKWRVLKEGRYFSIGLYIVLGITMYLAMLSNVIPETLDVELSSTAQKDIASPVTVMNEKATDEKRAQAALQVESKFTFQQKALTQIEKTGLLFDMIRKFNDKNSTEEKNQNEGTSEQQGSKQEGRVQTLKQRLSSEFGKKLPDKILKTLLQAEKGELAIAQDVTSTTINEMMNSEITWNNLQQIKASVEQKLPVSALRPKVREAVIAVTQAAIVPNYVLDTELTKQKRQEAIEAVEPVMIRKNQILVKEGQIINHDILHQLKIVGLLNNKFNPYPFVGLVILVVLLTGLLIHGLQGTPYKEGIRKYKPMLMYAVIFFTTLLIMKVTSLLYEFDIHGIGFIVPAAVGTMLTKMLLNERLAIVSSIVFAVCASIIFNVETTATVSFTFGIYTLFSCLAGGILLKKSNARPKILRAGGYVAFVNILVVFFFLMIKIGASSSIEIGLDFGFAFMSGFLAAVLTLGLMPFFEATFNILTKMRLIELSNPNHPLLRKVLTEAPGTYHHSVMVANLAEAACESIGADGLLARVGAYYHDVGKTKRPHFFIENQMNMGNPHDKISPQLSKTIIISHPNDGANMLRKYDLPKEIIDIAEQHHGTTLLKFFYQKAKDNYKTVSETEFRYPGPKAQTKESAVVEICDGVEAAVRSLSKPTPQKIELLVRKIIRERLEDGQFDECHITLKELDEIATSVCETLQGIFHSRIEYPVDELKKKVSHA